MVAHLAVLSAAQQEDGSEDMALDLLPESTWWKYYRYRPESYLPVPTSAPNKKGGYSGYRAGYGYFRGRRAVSDGPGPALNPLERTRRV